jgi:hypothetical protein
MREIVDRGFAKRNVPALGFHHRRQQPQILECDMTESDCGSPMLIHQILCFV